MEDVWKDLSLSSLHHHPTTTTTTTTSSSVTTAFHHLGFSFQDFLSTTPARERATGHNHSSTSSAVAGTLFGSTPLTISEPWLSLNLTRDDQLPNVERSEPPYGQAHKSTVADSLCPRRRRTVEFPILQKRVSVSAAEKSDNIISNEKKMRLIKSRESADRCRARKQAYTQELEIKLQKLKKENAELKIELQKKPILLPEKKLLQRTLTAPF